MTKKLSMKVKARLDQRGRAFRNRVGKRRRQKEIAQASRKRNRR